MTVGVEKGLMVVFRDGAEVRVLGFGSIGRFFENLKNFNIG